MVSRIILVLSLVIFTILIIFISITQRNTQYDFSQKFTDPRGNEIAYGLNWGGVSGLVINGILVSDKVLTDEQGRYIELRVPRNQNKNNETAVKAYFTEHGNLSVLEIANYIIPTEQVWEGMLISEYPGQLRSNEPIIVHLDYDEQSYNQIHEDYLKSSQISAFNISHLFLPI